MSTSNTPATKAQLRKMLSRTRAMQRQLVSNALAAVLLMVGFQVNIQALLESQHTEHATMMAMAWMQIFSIAVGVVTFYLLEWWVGPWLSKHLKVRHAAPRCQSEAELRKQWEVKP